MKKKTTKKKSAMRKQTKKPEQREERGMNIKQMVVRSAIREGFRLAQLGALALGGTLLGVKISF